MHIVVDRNIPLGAEAFSTIGDITAVDTRSFSPESVRHADAVIIRSETAVSKALLEGSSVKFVGTATIGTDHVDTEWLSSRGIGFASAPGCNANSVCEYIVAALLELGSRYGFMLEGTSLGIVGVGNIGSRVERAAGALGMRVMLNDPPLARATGDPKYRSLDEMMPADIITLHVPLTRSGGDATRHLFDARRMASMKQGSILLNASRGGVVETQALRNALLSGRLRGAVLDVWEGEPAIDAGLLMQTTLGTAHIAGYSLDGKVNAVRMIYEAACAHFSLDPVWRVSRLPDPGTKHIALPPEAPRSDRALLGLARQCYDITLDDRNLKALSQLPPPELGREFMMLRSGYRVRREFPATEVSGGSDRLRALIRSLGFTVAGEAPH